MPLLSLPFDILIKLLSDVNGESLLRCREVCTTFSTLIRNDVRLQYKLKLHRSGMVDNSSGQYAGIAISQRLDLLNQLISRRQRWSLAWPEGLIPGTQSMADIEDWSWEYTSKVLACLTMHSDVGLFDLLDSESTIPYHHRIMHPGPQIGMTQGLYLDPGQDLLIVMDTIDNQGGTRLRLHVLSLQDGSRHPGATSPLIEMNNFFGTASGFFESRIYGHLFAVGILQDTAAEQQIAIIDWTTGELMGVIKGYAYMFLDSQHILLGCLNHKLARVELRIHVVGGSQPIVVLPFPIFTPYFLSFGRDLREPTNAQNQYPFTADPELRIVTFSLRGPPPDPCQIICTFPALSIKAILRSQKHHTSEVPIEIPWGSWPQCTFLWPTKLPHMCVSGSRIAIFNTDEATQTVSIYRFHPQWFREPMTLRNLRDDNQDSRLDGYLAHVPSDASSIMTLPLPKPEQVVTTGSVKQVWMDEDLLLMVLPEGIQFIRA
ncbi:hypothetical protein BDN72DRAFT_849285 [Pluteus cervinus]|uniref:Uncharacterized protein n=1 Tax=Pluteus cervinus TaxID=181527 RepID=A0ACD3A7N8_9AGAR|nr:hypothetical protein BDN72DRAFT_849285 [Pluteus cervinus]